MVAALSGIDLTEVMDGILEIVPIVLPVVIGLISLRKGLSFLRGMLVGA